MLSSIVKNKCKMIVTAVNHSQPILYDVSKYQEYLDIPISAITQELTTRWWSILHMLSSIVKNIQPITLLSLARSLFLVKFLSQ